jgi:hypothetical protein
MKPLDTLLTGSRRIKESDLARLPRFDFASVCTLL